MFLSRLRAFGPSRGLLRNARFYSVESTVKPTVSAKFDALRNLEEENARLLRVVKKRVAERQKVQSEVLLRRILLLSS